MRWLVFAISAFVMLVFELGLAALLNIKGVTPSFLLILNVFIALSAPRKDAIWSALILGLLVDLIDSSKVGIEPGDFALIGPASLGYLTGVLVTLELRGLIFRDSPIVLAIMVVAAGTFVHLVIVAAITVRGLSWVPADAIPGWNVAEQLTRRFFTLLYSAVIAMPLGMILVRLDPLWNFDHRAGRGRAPRTRRMS